MSKYRSKLHFPSGRSKWVVASRAELARRLVAADYGEWVKIAAHEQSAAASLVSWGMAERNSSSNEYLRWSIMHERPRFNARRSVLSLYGEPVSGLTSEQRELLVAVSVSTASKQPHRVLVLNDARMQGRLRTLEQRGLLRIERSGRSQWVRNLAGALEHKAGGVWSLWMADTYPGRKVKT